MRGWLADWITHVEGMLLALPSCSIYPSRTSQSPSHIRHYDNVEHTRILSLPAYDNPRWLHLHHDPAHLPPS